MATTKLSDVEIFHTGIHTDSSGHTRTFTRADLERMVTKYDPSHHEAPVVIGHPRSNGPAYGWVTSLGMNGETLTADLGQLDPAFVEAVQAGRYKKRSISMNPDGTLRHVGFLGAVPPAVKGLADVELSTPKDAITYEYQEDTMGKDKQEQLVEKLQEQVADLTAKLAAAEGGEFAEKEARMKTKLSRIEDELEAEKSARQKAEADFAEYKAAEAARALGKRLDALVAEGKLTPAEKLREQAYCEALARAEATVDFSSSSGKTEQIPLQEAYLRELEGRLGHALLAEFSAPPASESGSISTANLVDNF